MRILFKTTCWLTSLNSSAPTFLQCHGPVSLPCRVEVAGGLARLREVEAVEDALVGEAPEPALPVLRGHPAVVHQT